ncbi:MAG: N-acetyltransferase family protein [Pseudomonadota bacterium]|nr:N-acetyltransferase family protein [Pseudomonadota bacterium]
MIDVACRLDLAEILAIYNEVIRNSTAVYTEFELSPDRGESWFEAKRAGGFPFIVSKDASGITGFGTFGEFRAPPCYQHTVEHSVHVRRDRRGQGVGRQLVSELMARAAAMQKHIMIAGIDADNLASIKLHQSLGFVNVGHFHEVGFKFGRWLDLVFLECRLPATKLSATVKQDSPRDPEGA